MEVYDVGAASLIHREEAAHSGAVWSLAALPDGSGFVSGSADKAVKVWSWAVVAQKGDEAAGRRLKVRLR